MADVPGLAVHYNHDLHVAGEFVNQYPRVGSLLRPNAEVLLLFDSYDDEAKRRKWQFHALGMSSLILGTLALLGVTAELVMHAWHLDTSPWLTIAIECTALFAFILIVWARFGGYRERWRIACFARERLRQWHFQMFLDGALIEGLVDNATTYRSIIERRFAEFKEALRSAEGSLFEFLHDTAVSSRLYHSVTEYSNPVIREEVFRALDFLRFHHQSQFARRKLVPTPQGSRLVLREHHHWAESIASISLLFAIVIPAFHLVLVVLSQLNAITLLPTFHVLLFGAAIALAVVSAAARAYRTGLTIPEEIDSYEEYAALISELRKVYLLPDAAPVVRHKALRELESEAVRELRRFLLHKEKATFVA